MPRGRGAIYLLDGYFYWFEIEKVGFYKNLSKF